MDDPELKPKIANVDNMIAAEMLGNLRDEYIKTGFTREEALELCKSMIAGAAGRRK